MCWVAMDRASQLAAMRGNAELQAQWGATAEEIKQDILLHGTTAGGCCASTTTRTRSTPPTLLAAIFGFLPGDDERLHATVMAIATI